MASTKDNIRGVLILIFVIALMGSGWIISFYKEKCQSKFDQRYNGVRRSLGVPIIVNNWHIATRNDDATHWNGPVEDIIGHKRKTVIFDGCDIVKEQDVYRLPNENGKRRWIEMSYKYREVVHKDSIRYQIESNSKMISKVTADSILNAGHINKDYK